MLLHFVSFFYKRWVRDNLENLRFSKNFVYQKFCRLSKYNHVMQVVSSTKLYKVAAWVGLGLGLSRTPLSPFPSHILRSIPPSLFFPSFPIPKIKFRKKKIYRDLKEGLSSGCRLLVSRHRI